ncbi:MAG: hypothetical protein ACK5X3_19990, partial [Pseudomonadota bacterium]
PTRRTTALAIPLCSLSLYRHAMTALCRWVGGFVLVISTVALALEQFGFAAAGAALAFVWLIAGQLAAFTSRQQPRDP